MADLLHCLVAEFAGRMSRAQTELSFGVAWTEQFQVCFKELRSSLTSALVLTYADFSLTFILEADASHGGLGAVLSQEQVA